MRPVIILFAKAPVAGRVKTRLVPPLTPDQAAQLHTALVWDAIEALQQLRGIDLELHTDTRTDAWTSAGLPQSLQCEGDLGLKMFNALDGALRRGREQVMIAGSDAPGLPLDYLQQLLTAEEDVALGPTDDGGFYAIACRRAHRDMFDRVEWSTERTRAQTIEAVRRSGLSAKLGAPWFDVDTPRDLDRMKTMPGLGRHTAKMIL